VFYIPAPEGLYRSDDGGVNFKLVNDGVKYPDEIKTVPYNAGVIWAYGKDGIKISKDFGETFTPLEKNFTTVYSLDFGMGKDGGKSLALYVFGVLEGYYGVFRSDDMGETFLDIRDDKVGLASAGTVIADRKIYGRIYMATGGRGFYMAEPQS
jgi:hypothetical protein